MYLRSFGDDMKATLRAVKREPALGGGHSKWLAWVKDFAGWLLPWVTTSHLSGIIGLEFDSPLFAKLCAARAILKR